MVSTDDNQPEIDRYYPAKLWAIQDNYEKSIDSRYRLSLNQNGIKPETHKSFLYARSRDICTLGEQFSNYKNESLNVSFLTLILESLVIAQEFSLSCLLLAVHRIIIPYSSSDRAYCEDGENDIVCLQRNFEAAGPKQVTAMALVLFVLVVILTFSEITEPKTSSKKNLNNTSFESTPSNYNVAVIHRLTDASLIAAILRFLSAVLSTLTASYSLDTVMALSVGGMVIHLFSCDFTYANGHERHQNNITSKTKQTDHCDENIKSLKRPVFHGGTVSLNSALFSTTLLASRISSNVFSYGFISFSVVIFAFYPAARHALSRKSLKEYVKENFLAIFPTLIVTIAFSLSTLLLLNGFERVTFILVEMLISIIAPALKWWLQRYKETFSGPWDIPHVEVEDNPSHSMN